MVMFIKSLPVHLLISHTNAGTCSKQWWIWHTWLYRSCGIYRNEILSGCSACMQANMIYWLWLSVVSNGIPLPNPRLVSHWVEIPIASAKDKIHCPYLTPKWINQSAEVLDLHMQCHCVRRGVFWEHYWFLCGWAHNEFTPHTKAHLFQCHILDIHLPSMHGVHWSNEAES